jgi:hypothetical protein
MISKRDVLKKYLLWRKISSPNSQGSYPHCLNCKYWNVTDCTNRKDEKYHTVYYAGLSTDSNLKYYIRKSKSHQREKCIKAFYPGNWVQRSYVE